MKNCGWDWDWMGGGGGGGGEGESGCCGCTWSVLESDCLSSLLNSDLNSDDGTDSELSAKLLHKNNKITILISKKKKITQCAWL